MIPGFKLSRRWLLAKERLVRLDHSRSLILGRTVWPFRQQTQMDDRRKQRDDNQIPVPHYMHNSLRQIAVYLSSVLLGRIWRPLLRCLQILRR